MKEYLATVKVKPGDTPQKYKFTAEDVSPAIKKLCTLVGVTSTINIHAYDMLEILKDPNSGVAYGYSPRSHKLPDSTPPSGGGASLPVPVKAVVEEEMYNPFQVLEA